MPASQAGRRGFESRLSLSFHFAGFWLVLISIPILLQLSCASTRSPAWRRSDSVRWIEKAEREYVRGKTADAIRLARRAIASDSSYRPARRMLVQWLITDEQYADAIAAGADFPYEAGVAFFHLERWNDAVLALESVDVSDSLYAASRYYLGRTYLAFGNTPRAIRAFDDVTDSSGLWRQRTDGELQRLGLTSVRRLDDSLWAAIQRSDSIRRIEWAFLICRILQLPVHSTTTENFRDLDSTNRMSRYARAAVERGCLERLPDGRFYPDHVMKRRNAAYYLWRMAGSDTVTVTSLWKDVPSNDWLAIPIHWAAVKSLVLPLRSGYFGAGENLSGRDAVAALQSFKSLWQHLHGQ